LGLTLQLSSPPELMAKEGYKFSRFILRSTLRSKDGSTFVARISYCVMRYANSNQGWALVHLLVLPFNLCTRVSQILHPRRLFVVLEREHCHRLLVLNEDAVARNYRVRIDRRVRNLVSRDFAVLLAVRLEGNQSGLLRQSNKSRAGVENRAKIAELVCVCPGGLAGLGIDAEEIAAVGQAEQQATPEHRRVKSCAEFCVAPKLLCDEAVTLFFDLDGLNALALPRVEHGLAIYYRAGAVVEPSLGRSRDLPQELPIGRGDAHDVFLRLHNELFGAFHRHQDGRGIGWAIAGPFPLLVAAG